MCYEPGLVQHAGGLTLPMCTILACSYNARHANVELVLAAFRDGLRKQGWLKA